MATSVHELKTLLLSMQPLIVFETAEEERAATLLAAAAEELRLPLFEWSVTTGLRRRGAKRAEESTLEPDRALTRIGAHTSEGVYLFKDLGPHLESPKTARLLRERCQELRATRSAIAITGRSLRLPESVQHKAVHVPIALPDEAEIHATVGPLLQSLRRLYDVRVDIDDARYRELLRALRGLTLNQARQAVAHAVIDDGVLDASDIPAVLDRKAGLLRDGGVLEYFPAATNAWEIGGFSRYIEWLDRSAVGFTGSAKELGLGAPKGAVLVGVQGCGKSLAAKITAQRWRLPLLKLDAGRLYDKYVGETEKNLGRALQVAEAMAPVVLWIDEIEKAFDTGSGAQSDSGLSRRLLATFLTWLQEGGEGVFVVATANQLAVLPPELLRKGRFDEVFFVDLPRAPERGTVFDIQLRARKQDPRAFDTDRLVRRTEGFSGAEIEQVVVSALYRALHAGEPLRMEHLLHEIGETVPLSVSRAGEIARLREEARRFVPVA